MHSACARLTAFVLLVSGFCATTVRAEHIPVDSPRWSLQGEEARVVEFKGRPALRLKGAVALLADANFETGVIEFDMALTDNTASFPGVFFRGVDDLNYEHFYLRPHQSGNPDANQYTPVINGVTGWQVYSEYNSQMRYRLNEWFRVRLEIADDSARVFVDSEEPRLVVSDLKRDRAAGFVMLRGSSGGAYFANISITPGSVAATPPAPAPVLPPGLIRTWAVSGAMPEADAYRAAEANRLDAIDWAPLAVETKGIANLARAAKRTDETPTVLARVSVRADKLRTVPLRFGFSDRVRVYLNGMLLFAGNDQQGSRDYRFLGTVGLYDTLYLPLRAGDNEIVFAVTESGSAPNGGGWAAYGVFDDVAGLGLSPR
jgi:hypothetical protein